MNHKTLIEPLSLTKFGLVCSCGYQAIGTKREIQKLRYPTYPDHHTFGDK